MLLEKVRGVLDELLMKLLYCTYPIKDLQDIR
jgi:hypothetical protein